VILAARRCFPCTRTRLDVARSRVTRPRRLARLEEELPVDEDVANELDEPVGRGTALPPVEGVGAAPAPLGAAGTVGAGIVGAGAIAGAGGIVGVGVSTGGGGGGGGVGGSGREMVGTETVIPGTPTSPSACADSTPAAAAAHETASIRAAGPTRLAITFRLENGVPAQTGTRYC
jgi:hypothetical protein